MTRILWIDDEVELLKAPIKFLEQKDFSVATASNGIDALDILREQAFDIVFLDEQMPGMGGLEVLAELKKMLPNLPVIMITKSEEERIMEDAIGAKIADYLIKPVKPTQILLACKKILEGRQLIHEKANVGYQQDFRHIAMQFFDAQTHDDWSDIHKKLVYWEMEMEHNPDKSMSEVLDSQRQEANTNFGQFVRENYLDWVNSSPSDDRPVLSHEVIPTAVLPHLGQGHKSVFMILVDCLRFDQWKALEPIIGQYFRIDSEKTYTSILPTATQYARNAIFAGQMPLEIAKKHPNLWMNDDDEGSKNSHEADFLAEQLKREKINVKHSYHKVISLEEGKTLTDNVMNLLSNPFNVLVYNFIDLLSHSRTEMNIIRELAPNEAAYRSLSRSWLEHSPFLQLLRRLAENNVKVILTTDHGTMRVKNPVRIIGDRTTTTNLRYKQGKNLNYDFNDRHLFTVRNPKDAMLPAANVSSTYVFAMENSFFAYPNNYNYYVNYYRDTFQHGGVSMEEMIIPIIELTPKR